MNEQLTMQRGAKAITQAFRIRNQSGGKVLVPYIMAGDPDLGTTEKIVRALSGLGADVIELGMPFSDPLADGPVIQRAGQRALRQNITLPRLLESVKELRLTVDTPIVIMTYYNLFYKYGLQQFAQDAAQAGVDGLIIPDLPIEEAEEFQSYLDESNLALICLIAPTSTDTRIQNITKVAKGFVYYVSRTGTTGVQQDVSADLEFNINRIRQYTDLPIAVGFGVSNAELAKTISAHADGVVIGSAIVRVIEETTHMHDRVAAKFVKPIVDVLHGNT
ncbi:tryptophan synthase subunit alpha [bacterium]|nr:tryptophan synthase subunit alpha [bacterium]